MADAFLDAKQLRILEEEVERLGQRKGVLKEILDGYEAACEERPDEKFTKLDWLYERLPLYRHQDGDFSGTYPIMTDHVPDRLVPMLMTYHVRPRVLLSRLRLEYHWVTLSTNKGDLNVLLKEDDRDIGWAFWMPPQTLSKDDENTEVLATVDGQYYCRQQLKTAVGYIEISQWTGDISIHSATWKEEQINGN